MAELLRKGLEEENHSITVTGDGSEGLEFARTYDFDVIVLDIMLPSIDGFEVVRRLRRSGNRTPILMLTARDAVSDTVRALDVGADDYITKPFSFSELLARLRALSRRGPIERLPRLTVGDLVLDPVSHRVIRKNKEIRLTNTEYRLLELLMRKAGRVLSRHALIDGVWGVSGSPENNTLDAFIRLLRNKIGFGHGSKMIETVRGVGYRLRAEDK